MNINKINIIYFSPTKGTEKVSKAIAKGTGLKTDEYNFTYISSAPRTPVFKNDELVLIGLPVYYGRIPYVCLNYLKSLKAHNTPCILLAVYGNRHYDDILAEMEDIALKQGFLPMAAAAFLAQHSYTSNLAFGRPGSEDLKKAEIFGKVIIAKLSKNGICALPYNTIPGTRPYKPYGKNNAPVPEFSPVINENCVKCGVCVKVCPAEAVTNDGGVINTDKNKCITCRACAINCEHKAIDIVDKQFLQAVKYLESNFADKKEPLIIL